MLSERKIYVGKHSKEIQEKAFELGWEWRRMEKQYGNTSFRNNLSIDDLVRIASLPTTMEIQFPEEEDKCVCNF